MATTPLIRTIEHLLPRSATWKLSPGKRLTALFHALSGALDDARNFLDAVYLDQWPATTRQLEAFEFELGLMPAAGASEQARRQAVAASLMEGGGQSRQELQRVLRGAGLDVHIHEVWPTGRSVAEVAGTPEQRHPWAYLRREAIGAVTCGGGALAGETTAQCAGLTTLGAPYIVNSRGPGSAQPELPPYDQGNYFIFIGGEQFPDYAKVPKERRAELERRVQKIKPAHLWVGLLVDYV